MFEEATHEVSGDYASASVVISINVTLKKIISQQQQDDNEIMAMKIGMLRSLED